ncbi:MAG: tetraacyldisaccharide 4'-kinase [Bdellovibrionales bacterium]|nr:tetraacyldisaccharide 4'-kinase [Bdellovibrionales bacterium]
MLKVLTWLYSKIINLRNILYDKSILPTFKSNLPVISIGNISIGGTGKTPLVRYLCLELKKQNLKPVVLTRGYKGSIYGPHLVSKADSHLEVGDEPLLIWETAKVPVVIAKKRVAGALFIEENNLGNIIILDDGLQHRSLKRDIDIICIDASSSQSLDNFFKGKVIPSGNLREPLKHALKRSNALVFSMRQLSQEAPDYIKKHYSYLPDNLDKFISKLINPHIKRGSEKLTAQAVTAFCGIANPEAFRKTLDQLGFEVTEFISFRDHHNFSKTELEKLSDIASKTPLVCTGKDFVKLPDSIKQKVYCLEFDLEVNPNLLKLIKPNSGY